MNHLWKFLITPANCLKTFASIVGGKGILPSNIEFYPQCTSCQSKTRPKVAKRKQVVTSDVKKMQKTLVQD